MKIKLIALDMDGTLLNSKSQISQKNLEALKKAKEMGIKIVLASGRPCLSLRPYIDLLDLHEDDDYTICFNGSQVLNNNTSSIIYSKCISLEDMKKAFFLSNKLGVSFYAYSMKEEILYDSYSSYIDYEHKLTTNPIRQADLSQINEPYYIKMTFTDSKEKIDAITKEVENVFANTHTVVRSHDIFLEIINKETSKGSALLFLLNHLNISPEECMSFGDNQNDYTLITSVKYGIAMKNSPSESLKKAAFEVTLSNDEDGVAHIINKYILK